MERHEYERLSLEELYLRWQETGDIGASIAWMKRVRADADPRLRAALDRRVRKQVTPDVVQAITRNMIRGFLVDDEIECAKVLLDVHFRSTVPEAREQRKAFEAVLTPETFGQIVQKLWALANAGDKAAARQVRRLERRGVRPPKP